MVALSISDETSAKHVTKPAELERRPNRLFDLAQLECRWSEEEGALWTFMTPTDRPNFNLPMLRDFAAWQDAILDTFGGEDAGLRYIILGSRFPGVFNYGGDLALFTQLILDADRTGLESYGKTCVRILHRNMQALSLPAITIGLVQGDALGGGFESLLSFDIVIAERGSRFGLPEAIFGLFPGMGAHSILARRLGSARADELIRSARTYSAEEMAELGLVHELADPGRGVEAVADYMRRNARFHAGQRGAHRARRLVEDITLHEMEQVVEIWADAALHLTPTQLKMMNRLAGAQTRLSEAAAS